MDKHPEDEGLEDEDWDIILEVTYTDPQGNRHVLWGSIDEVARSGLPKGDVRMFKGRIEVVDKVELTFDLSDPATQELLAALQYCPRAEDEAAEDAEDDNDESPYDDEDHPPQTLF